MIDHRCRISTILSSSPTLISERVTRAIHKGGQKNNSMSNARKRDGYLHRRLGYVSTQSGSIHYSCLVFLLTCLFSQVSSSPTPEPNITYHNGLSTTSLYDQARTFNVRVIAATCAAISMTASFVAFYWFYRMEKRFRHRYAHYC